MVDVVADASQSQVERRLAVLHSHAFPLEPIPNNFSCSHNGLSDAAGQQPGCCSPARVSRARRLHCIMSADEKRPQMIDSRSAEKSAGWWGAFAGLITAVLVAFPVSTAFAFATQPATQPSTQPVPPDAR